MELSVFVIWRSVTRFTVLVSDAELLPGVGSVTLDGAVMVAVLVILPLVAVTFAETVIS